MKYFLKKINLPRNIIDKIYKFLDYTNEIKNIKKIWFKRLIHPDFSYYDKNMIKYHLNNENMMLSILLKNNSYDIINNIHKNNLKDSKNNEFYKKYFFS